MTIHPQSRRIHRHTGAFVAVLALAVPLAACSGDPEPRVADPTPSATPSTSAPTSTEPPADETPEAFVRRFEEATVEMQRSGETAEYRALLSDCRDCANLADMVDEIYNDGGQITGASSRVANVVIRLDDPPLAVVEYDLRSTPTQIIRVSGESETLPGGSSTYQANLDHSSGEWRVTRISRLP